MSVTDVSANPDLETAPPPRPASRLKGPAAIWTRLLVVCALLAGSGELRRLQARRVGAVLTEGRKSPFPLKELPLNLGPWKGETAELDPQIARSTGAVEHVFRRYVNQMTGVSLDLIVLYGPAADMFIHSPEVCYPKAGYETAAGPDDRVIRGDGFEAPFRSLVYMKGEGGQTERQEVYYSWRFNGRWSHQIGTFKQLERIPGMFKVHLARPVTENERRDVGNPCESLLEALVPEIEHRLSARNDGK